MMRTIKPLAGLKGLLVRGVDVTDNSVTLNWRKVDDAVCYELWRQDGGTRSIVKVFNHQTDEAKITGLNPDSKYYFYMLAVFEDNTMSDPTFLDVTTAAKRPNNNDDVKEALRYFLWAWRHSTLSDVEDAVRTAERVLKS